MANCIIPPWLSFLIYLIGPIPVNYALNLFQGLNEIFMISASINLIPMVSIRKLLAITLLLLTMILMLPPFPKYSIFMKCFHTYCVIYIHSNPTRCAVWSSWENLELWELKWSTPDLGLTTARGRPEVQSFWYFLESSLKISSSTLKRDQWYCARLWVGHTEMCKAVCATCLLLSPTTRAGCF